MMQMIKFSYAQTAMIDHAELEQISTSLIKEIKHVGEQLNNGYETPYAFIHAASDNAIHAEIKKVAQEKKALKPSMLIVIGIGGSNLGAMAVHEALYGRFYNEQNPEIKVYFADAVDTDYIYDIILLMEQEFEKGNDVVLNVISKSGTTTETIVNFQLFLYILKLNKKSDYQKYVVVITDYKSKLWDFGQSNGLTCLSIPAKVGGRYSVLTSVGLFPLALLGVDIQELCAGAHSMLAALTNHDIFNNPAALSAAILYHHYSLGKNIHDSFLFSQDLEALGKWYRQLMAESIGKQYNKLGQEVSVGMTPTVSIGSIDLHSMAQLYFGGPHDKFTTFVSIAKRKARLGLPIEPVFEKLVDNIQGKFLSSINDAILQGVYVAFQKNNRPFISIELPEKNAWSIGQFLQLKMFEIVYLGYLLDVNPFDQPNVDLYKQETREILAHE